ncbi:MAG: family 16 glycoside hydrolase [Verrucomicrobiota bacterium]
MERFTDMPLELPEASRFGLAPEFLIGNGRYVLKQFLGQKDGSERWTAHDEVLGKNVTLQFITDDPAVADLLLNQLRQHLPRHGTPPHASLVRVWDLGREGALLFLVLEPAAGPSLDAFRQQQQNQVLTWDQLAPVARTLSAVCEALHDTRFIHRGLTPETILLTPEPGGLRVDGNAWSMGLAERTVADHLPAMRAHYQAFQSPQSLAGELPQESDDIYAFGAVLYTMLTGSPPRAYSLASHSDQAKSPVFLPDRLAQRGLVNTVPPQVTTLIMACLAPHPDQRPLSMREVSLRLQPEAALRQMVLSAGRISSAADTAEALKSQTPTLVVQTARWEGVRETAAAPTWRVHLVSLLLAGLGLIGLGIGAGAWFSLRHASANAEPDTDLPPLSRVDIRRRTGVSTSGTKGTNHASISSNAVHGATASVRKKSGKLPTDKPLPPRPTIFFEEESLFNGVSLANWEGDTNCWSVQAGVLVGSAGTNYQHLDNMPLCLTTSQVGDFELKLLCKGDASAGVLYRLQTKPEGFAGYLARATPPDSGQLYGLVPRKPKRKLTEPGRNVSIVREEDKDRRVFQGRVATPEELARAYQPDDWNEIIIVAKGNRLVHQVNGVTVSAVTDESPNFSQAAGEFALFFSPRHSRGARVEFKDIRIKHFPSGGAGNGGGGN